MQVKVEAMYGTASTLLVEHALSSRYFELKGDFILVGRFLVFDLPIIISFIIAVSVLNIFS